MQALRTRQLGSTPLSLDAVVATGAAGRADSSSVTIIRGSGAVSTRPPYEQSAAAPVSVAAPAAREAQFESAKTAAAQRAVTTLSAADSVGADLRAAGTQRVGARTFALVDGTWTDARYTRTMHTVRVKAYSAAYFALVEKLEDLRAPFALMGPSGTPGVLVVGRSVAVAVAADGVETLSARELSAVESGW